MFILCFVFRWWPPGFEGHSTVLFWCGWVTKHSKWTRVFTITSAALLLKIAMYRKNPKLLSISSLLNHGVVIIVRTNCGHNNPDCFYLVNMYDQNMCRSLGEQYCELWFWFVLLCVVVWNSYTELMIFSPSHLGLSINL